MELMEGSTESGKGMEGCSLIGNGADRHNSCCYIFTYSGEPSKLLDRNTDILIDIAIHSEVKVSISHRYSQRVKGISISHRYSQRVKGISISKTTRR